MCEVILNPKKTSNFSLSLSLYIYIYIYIYKDREVIGYAFMKKLIKHFYSSKFSFFYPFEN